MDASSGAGGAGEAPRNMAAIDMALEDVIMTKAKQKNQHQHHHHHHNNNNNTTTARRTTSGGSVVKPHQFKVNGGRRPTFSSARTVEAASGRSLRISVDAARMTSRLADAANGGSRPQGCLSVSNLHHEELFGTIGKVTKVQLDYDRSGRSNGSATVFFATRTDAVSASDRFHNIPLDGLPMRINVVEVPRQHRGSGRPEADRLDRWDHAKFQSRPDESRSGRSRGRASEPSRHGGPRRGKDVSAEMLDNDLDSYMMQKD